MQFSGESKGWGTCGRPSPLHKKHFICSAELQSNKFVYQEMIKIIATICYILRLKWSKFDFGRPHWGRSQRFPQTPSWIQEVLLPKEGGRKRRKGKKEKRGERQGEKERGGEAKGIFRPLG